MNWLASALMAAICLGDSAAAQTQSAPNGVHQTLKPHKPAMSAPRSLLAPVRLAPNAAAGLAKPYGGAPIDVTNYHYDNNRTGWNPTETDLTPAVVKSANFGLLTNLSVDGNVFAQPLLVSNFTMPDNTVHDVLIIVTGHNSVYAFDARSYATLWHVNLDQSQSIDDVGCGDDLSGGGDRTVQLRVPCQTPRARHVHGAGCKATRGNFGDRAAG